ncbi:FAD dependent oxidoreductase [Armillaria solidipes]|uniref:FAD dependent oxidoreductase n=1 Tax=Armillaria solidipes TaxID=1076256 RepID=A0A2H3C5G7_9AGAR|nr:FAD dependent oxidoreductase [Armillaria solidipes]
MLSRNLVLQIASAFSTILYVLADDPPAGIHALPVANMTSSFWLNSPANPNPLRNTGSDGPLTPGADVCIIGSGLTGVSAAYHLSQSEIASHLKVVVLEAREFCSGATGRNGGFLSAASCTSFVELQEEYGTNEALRGLLLEHHSYNFTIDVLERHGLLNEASILFGDSIHLFEVEDEYASNKADCDAAKAAGMDMTGINWWTADYVAKRFNTSSYGAYTNPFAATWPQKIATQMYLLAERKFDLSLHTHTPVLSVNDIGRNVWSLITPRGSVECKYVIHATNGYAASLIPHMWGYGGIMPERGQMIAIRAGVDLKELSTDGWSSDTGYWIPQLDDGKLPMVLFGADSGAFNGTGHVHNTTDDSEVVQSTLDLEVAYLPQLQPKLYIKETPAEYAWTGIMGYTATGDPFVGPVIDNVNHVKYVNQYISAGYNGHGMPRTGACAEAVVQMIIANITGKEWIQPDWFPSRYLTWNKIQ